jgi:hypothetical protein
MPQTRGFDFPQMPGYEVPKVVYDKSPMPANGTLSPATLLYLKFYIGRAFYRFKTCNVHPFSVGLITRLLDHPLSAKQMKQFEAELKRLGISDLKCRMILELLNKQGYLTTIYMMNDQTMAECYEFGFDRLRG